MKDNKLTMTGDIDPAYVVIELRSICYTELVSFEQHGEKKKEKKKPEKDSVAGLVKAYQAYISYKTSYYHIKSGKQTIMELVAAYDPRSPHLIDVDIEVASTLNSGKTAPPPPASVSLDLLKADFEGEFSRITQAEIMEAGDVNDRPKKKPRLITSDLILLVTESSMLATS
ncbi:hypothetical protein JRO89_XS02G0270300 [Xanthoceras sorbifolium]|uniref:Uncharacterized protein n=1 Tax=Xanthoceras sorbifolium TaxID=99658 RepID=A0ABQ8IHC7_9ROSI|nr:hypothetical protein JRO89_XS02G0270300 [Xanthoceras sorbifolium]